MASIFEMRDKHNEKKGLSLLDVLGIAKSGFDVYGMLQGLEGQKQAQALAERGLGLEEGRGELERERFDYGKEQDTLTRRDKQQQGLMDMLTDFTDAQTTHSKAREDRRRWTQEFGLEQSQEDRLAAEADARRRMENFGLAESGWRPTEGMTAYPMPGEGQAEPLFTGGMYKYPGQEGTQLNVPKSGMYGQARRLYVDTMFGGEEGFYAAQQAGQVDPKEMEAGILALAQNMANPFVGGATGEGADPSEGADLSVGAVFMELAQGLGAEDPTVRAEAESDFAQMQQGDPASAAIVDMLRTRGLGGIGTPIATEQPPPGLWAAIEQARAQAGRKRWVVPFTRKARGQEMAELEQAIQTLHDRVRAYGGGGYTPEVREELRALERRLQVLRRIDRPAPGGDIRGL